MSNREANRNGAERLPGPSEVIMLVHGEGGRAMRRLIGGVIQQELGAVGPTELCDGASVPGPGPWVITTDSFVVSPWQFPGGDIGTLAVYGTINDLAVSGARPRYLTLAFILEEGLPLEVLRRVLRSVRSAADRCGIKILGGDTKVVGRGQCDGLYLNTTGLGQLHPKASLGLEHIRPGDAILVSGPIAAHGMAVLAARTGLELEGDLVSDVGPVHEAALALLDRFEVHFMRDPTRGGVAAVLHEIAEATGLVPIIDEAKVPVTASVRAACELLGLDPIHVACEGRFVAVLPEHQAEPAVRFLREEGLAPEAAIIGRVEEREGPPYVAVTTPLGLERVLDEPAGAPLPRIC